MLNIDPNRIKLAFGTIVVSNNNLLVTGVGGQFIRVMGWTAQANGALIGAFTLKSASGGTLLMPPMVVPPNAAGLIDRQPVIDSGYFDTVNAGDGLYVDITVGAVCLMVYYIQYTP